jgi:probable O-glycosylation ligase (exosortase A-associated)
MSNVTSTAVVKPGLRSHASRATSSEPTWAPYGAITAVLFAYLIVDYVRPHDLWPPLALARPGLLLTLILIPFSLTRFGDPVYRDKGIRCLMLFIAFGAFSVVYAFNTYWVYQYSKLMTQFFLAGVIPICVLISTMGRLRKLMALWVGVHCYLGAYGMLNGGLGPGSFLEDENDLALALNMALPYAYFLQRSPSLSKRHRLALLVAIALIVGGVIATMSRGGFIGLIVTTAAIVWCSKNRLRNALVVCALAAVFVLFTPQQYKSEVQTITNVGDETRLERLVSWELAWRMFLDNPVLGVGFGNYPWRVQEYQEEGDYSRGLGGRAAHSFYFTLWPETGLVGTLLVTMIVLHIVNRQRRALKIGREAPPGEDGEFIEACARATIVALISFLATSTFISVLYYPELWYLLGFSYAIHRNAQSLTAAKPA